MTVSTQVSRNEYTGNGATTQYDFTFRILDKSHLLVQTLDTSESIVTLTLGTDYTVTGVNRYNGGKVVLTSALPAGYKISIERSTPVTQESSIRNQGGFLPEIHEDAFDKLTMIIQRMYGWWSGLALKKPSWLANYYDAMNNRIRNLRDPALAQDAATKSYVDSSDSDLQHQITSNFNRSLRVPDSYISQLPSAEDRAWKGLGFDGAGQPKLQDPAGTGLWGYVPAMGSFEQGSLLTQRFEVLLWESTDEYWRWDGVMPKVVLPGSTPATAGGTGKGKWIDVTDATLRQNLGSGEEGMGSALLMHHTGKRVAEYLDLYLATVFFITPEQYGAKGDTVQDDSDALEDAINKAVATSLMSGGVYTPVVVQLNKPYRITRTITIDASRVRLNAISGCGVYVDPDGTYTDNKVFNITGSGPNAAVAASKVGALFDGVLFLTGGEKKLDLFHAVRDSTASNDNGACLHNVSNIAARGFRTIFTHGAGGWGWNFIGCLFSGNINLMDIITAGDTYERHTFVGCLWGNGGYAFKMNNPNGKIYWTGGSVDYCDGLAQIAQGHMEVNGHNEWTARDKPIVEITGSNASVTVSGTMFVRGNTDTQYYMFQQYQKRQVTLKDTVFITDGVNASKGLISNLEVVKSNLTFPNDAAKIIAYHSSDESLLTSNNAVVDFSLSATANHTVSVTDGKLTVTAVTGGTTSHLYIDIPVMGNTKVGFKLVASNTSSLGAISLNKSLLTLSKRQISDLSTSGTASWPASAASIAGGSVTLFDIPRQAAFLRLDFNVANLTTGTSFIIESLKMFTY
ncbi:phage tail fiber protein [Klebsiella pneumoniae]|uniref:phage tail fiber domain-containing protein n=1 Tax=Klebsiella pneumoniae TaxID=573 RepID=UPI001F0F184D|nr:phage tail fiber protein [Klebsiella pneumoniae]